MSHPTQLHPAGRDLQPAHEFILGLATPDVAPRNIPKRGVSQFLNENIPADHAATLAKIADLEAKLSVERDYRLYLEAIASAANIQLERA